MSLEDFGLMIMVALLPSTINGLYYERYSVALADTLFYLLIGVDFTCLNYFKRILVPCSVLLFCIGLILLQVVSTEVLVN